MDKSIPPGGYKIVKEGNENVMHINYEKIPYLPSVEGNSFCMMDTIDKLAENPDVARLIFSQRRNYGYNYEQTQLLMEIAQIYSYLVKSKKALSLQAMGYGVESEATLAQRHALVRDIVFNLLKADPLGAYVELKRLMRMEHAKLKDIKVPKIKKSMEVFYNLLYDIYTLLDKTKLIKLAKSYLPGYQAGDRSVYKLIFRPSITPDFMYTRLMSKLPLDSEQLEMYSVDNADITILDVPKKDIKYLYHMVPPEFKLSEDKYALVDLARGVLAEHQPKKEEFLEPERLRTTFTNIGQDLLRELAESQGVDLSVKASKELAQILVRHTIGFGIVELMLRDQRVQDITINSPMGQTPAFLLHQDYNECYSNIVPSTSDYESWASKFRLLSGRPLDEANPILDTELIVPGARARIGIIGKPLNPFGFGFAFRRHRDKPWTLPLFVENKMISPLAAGLLSFLIDGARTMLVAGTRSSGKTSLLGSCLVELMRKYRVITVEDSVAGDSEIIVERNGEFERTTVGNLVDGLINRHGKWYNLTGHEVLGNDENIKVFSMDKDGKIKLSNVSKFIRHEVKKPMYEITTRTGRKIKVTGDHSLFGLGENAEIKEINGKEFKKGDFIATPRQLFYGKKLDSFDIIEHLDKIDKGYLIGENIKEFCKKYKFEIKQLGKEYNHNRSLVDKWIREGKLPIKILKDMSCLGYNIREIKDVQFKYSGNSETIPSKIDLDKDLLTFIGLWIADGCYDKKSIIMSVSSKEEQALVQRIAEKFNFGVKIHSDQFSLMINSNSLRFFMREILGLKGNAFTKRMPSWMFNLSQEQLGFVLKGMFSGDGCASDKEIVIPLVSLNLLKDIQTFLLRFGIIFRIRKKRRDNTFNAAISNVKSWKLFKENIGFLQEYKNNKLDLLCEKKSTHDTSDIIPLQLITKNGIKKIYNDFKHRDYIYRNNNVGRTKLGQIVSQISVQSQLVANLSLLANSDLFWDQVEEVRCIENYEGFVYDLSVPGDESFVCENIVAHNTLELPTDALRKFGYNIQPMKVRSALAKGGTEISAAEGIRTTLRLGDSALIVGEVRSEEALALYEAMRVGALANLVAGTIHGDSPYGVFDRVVNDLKVPKTSFKATDIIVVANPLKSPDGLHKWMRVTQITEVRKTWEEDPLRERGFVDLMKYNSKTDQLEPTDDLINGDSEILKSIGANVKEWVGNWDAIWDNITLRAEIKKKIVEAAKNAKNPEMLEAEFVIAANDHLHRVSDEVREETGELDSKRILFEWESWLKRKVRDLKIK